MKKYSLIHILDVVKLKFDLKMKLTTLLLFIALFQINANTYSQKTKISLDLTNTSIENVFDEIEKKTEFNIFYNNAIFNFNKKVSIHVKKQSIKKILDILLANSNITYEVVNKQIVLTKKVQKPVVLQYKNSLRTLILQQQISGLITDESGEPLPGATIIVKGTNIGTSTDFDGKYSLTAPDDATTLVITFIGYKTIEVEIDDRSTINVQLKTDTASLDEVVLIGYGTVKKEALTGSVGVVTIKNITNQAPTVNLDNALQGQVAGVSVESSNGQPGAASRIRIRGTTSLFGSNQPLFVINGVPIEAESNIPIGGSEGGVLGDNLDQQGLSTPLGNINAEDIASISILKDASATAIYGSRAANGVIIIETKRGAYATAPTFNAGYSYSTQNAQTLEVLNAAQFREVWTTAVENGTSNNSFAQSVLDGSYFGDADTNWEDEVSRGNPVTKTFNFSVRGGSKKTRYNTSVGINQNNGVFDNSNFDRYSFSVNLDTQVNDALRFGTDLIISQTDQTSNDSGLTDLLYTYRPDIPIYDEDGNFTRSRSIFQNPVALSKAINTNESLLLIGSLFAELKLAEGLNFKTSFLINYNTGNQYSFYPKFTNRGGLSFFTNDEGDGYAQESRSRRVETTWRNTLSYSKLFNKHKVDALLGAEFIKNKSSNVKAWGEGFFNDVLTNVSSATVFTNGSSFESGSGLASYLGRFNYDYDNRYYLTLTGRVDGSSKFAVDNQYAFFPSMAVAWRISNESFLENSTFIDELKLRMSIGTSGRQSFGDFAWRTLFSTYFYGGDPAVILDQLGNNGLKWETSRQFDLGLDFSFLKNRLLGALGYYTKDTKDVLFSVRTPGSTGSSSIIANVAEISNRGLELMLGGDIIRTDNFNWNLSFNITNNNNKLTRISDDFKNEDGIVTGFGTAGRLREGDPIGLIFGYVSEGIFQTQAEIDALNTVSPTGFYQVEGTAPGDLKFRDITGPDGVPDGRVTILDQQVIGDTQPDFFGGFDSSWSYKGFTLSAQFTYSVGNELLNQRLARSTNFVTFRDENKAALVLNAWTPQNTNTNIPRSVYRDPNNNDRPSSQYLYDASFLRLRALNFNYAFSRKVLDQTFLKSASIFVVAQNLFTITNYPGANPEATSVFNNDLASGRDNNAFPLAKVFTAGIRIGF
ncbi:MAG: TonB-dependent receptor [Flavobacteriaceae bacterium]|nr:TonB-dependent receptor [Flavobacteriaceae bacterium]